MPFPYIENLRSMVGPILLRSVIWAIGLPVTFLLLQMPKLRAGFHWIVSRVPRNPKSHALLLFVLSIGGRLAILHQKPVPLAGVHDEQSYLLAADTFAHGRLTNPTPQFWSHFETYHELFHPSYMSKYPPGQGIALAIGQVLFHLPFAGVMLSCAFMCAALYWALSAIMPRRWAFLGGAIAVVQFSWLSFWDNSYYGGAMAALAGCLFLGALLRLRRRVTALHAGIFGVSIFLLAITRPYEGLLLAFPGVIWLIVAIARKPQRRHWAQALAVVLLILASGGVWLGYYNFRITGSPFDLPAAELQRQCQVTPVFIFQPLAAGTQCAVSVQKNQYVKFELPAYLLSRTVTGFAGETVVRIVGTWVFYGGTAFALAPLGLLLCWRNAKLRWMALLLAFMFVGWEAETFGQVHYYAPATPVLYAIGLIGLRALCCWKRHQRLGQILVFASVLSFGLAAVAEMGQAPVRAVFNVSHHQVTGYFDNYWKSRASVESALEGIPGKHLVLVRYPQEHDANQEWVFNGYDIPGQRIIWAHDLDPSDPDKPLICHYRDRHIWIVSPVDTEAWSVEQAQRALKAVDSAQVCAAAGDNVGMFVPGPRMDSLSAAKH